jgi:dienelactone hydrolase
MGPGLRFRSPWPSRVLGLTFGLGLGWGWELTAPPTSAQVIPPPQARGSIVDLRRYDTLQTYDLGTLPLAPTGVEPEWATMPVSLTGLVGLPTGHGPVPWVVLLHGRHGGCHFAGPGPSQWPCEDPPYDQGLAYLAQGLVEAGFGVIVPNLNAAFSATYGATPDQRNTLVDQRSQAILDAHLFRLATAHRGEDPGFGADLTRQIAGRVDWNRLGLVGHSMGGGAAALNALTRQDRTRSTQMADGLGPVSALILVAPTRSHPLAQWEESYQLPDIPTALLLGGCDRDITDFSSLYYAETAAQDLQRTTPVAVVMPLGANHNFFNAAVREDDDYRRPDHAALCNPQQSRQRLSRVAQETWLVRYSQAFFTATFPPVSAVTLPDAPGNLGLSAQQPAPTQIAQVPIITHLVWPSAQRDVIFSAQGLLATWPGTSQTIYEASPQWRLTPCPAFSPCGNLPRPHPPFPSLLRLQWDSSTEFLRFPFVQRDIRGMDALQLRIAADPNDPNPSFAVVVRDRPGRAARVDIPPTTPALYRFEAPHRSATLPIYPTAIRIPLAQFQGVDFANLESLDLVFDTAPQGTLYLTSLEWLREPPR